VHGKGPNTPDINWIFVAPKLKKSPCSIWKNILGAWFNVRAGMAKSDLTTQVEVLRQPIFENPLVTNSDGNPLGVSGLSEGCTFAKSGCTRIKDL
jgi:hypothetical protein